MVPSGNSLPEDVERKLQTLKNRNDKTLLQVAEQSKFRPTRAMVNRLKFMRQGSWFGVLMCLIAIFLPHTIQLNFLPLIWIGLFAEIIGLTSLMLPSRKLQAPAKYAAMTLFLAQAVPLTLLLVSGPYAKSVPGSLLDMTVAGHNSSFISLLIMVTMFTRVTKALDAHLSSFPRPKSRQGRMALEGLTTLSVLSAGFLMFSFISWQSMPEFFVGLGCLGFCGIVVITNILLANYTAMLRLEAMQDKSPPSLS